MKSPKLLIIDLFCGAGGTTTGFENNIDCMVIACVNHDANAIKSHSANHPDTVHFTEDMRTLDLSVLNEIARSERSKYPNALLILWASLECTNFSKAKGGQPRDADSRTLADHLERYVQALNPDYIMIENVVEFMSWGPLDDKGKPVSRKNGQDFMRWQNEMCAFGYRAEWKELNSANYGAYTSRNRLFGIFAKNDLPIAWPAATHSKKPSHSLYGGSLEKWKAVKDVLDFTDEGNSIFERKKDLSDKTLERIYAGLIKFVAGGKDAFLMKWNSVNRNTGVHIPPDMEQPSPVITAQNRLGITFISKYFSGKPDGKNITIDGPAGTIKTIDSQALVRATFLVQRNSGSPDSKIMTVDAPARTLTSTGGNQEIVNPSFITLYYTGGGQVASIENVSPCLTTKDRQALVTPYFIMRDFTNGGESSSIETPIGSILPVPKSNLVTPFIMNTNFGNGPTGINEPHNVITANRKWSYIVNPSHGGHSTSSDEPCPVIVARQDKAPLSMLCVVGYDGIKGETLYRFYIRIDSRDSDIMIKIKEFMALYLIKDIKMRMLKILELLKIQGFPDNYVLIGTQADQKKSIGNSVHPLMPDHMASAILDKLTTNKAA